MNKKHLQERSKGSGLSAYKMDQKSQETPVSIFPCMMQRFFYN